jgi:hypothetical protein
LAVGAAIWAAVRLHDFLAGKAFRPIHDGRDRRRRDDFANFAGRIQLHFVIVLARVQGIEIGNTVNPKDDSFAISTQRTTRRVLQTSQK